MSTEVAVVRFKNGDVFYTAYHGTSSAINYVLLPSEQEVIKDPFSDPKESLEEFYRRLNESTYSDEKFVEVYTPYAGGIHWAAKASRKAMRITDGLSDADSEHGCPDWAVGLVTSEALKF